MAKTKQVGVEEDLFELTQAAYDELVKELEERTNVEREEIAKEIAEARELGDLRENHAYSVAMEKKDMNESRISILEDMIKRSKIIHANGSNNIATIGKKVQITNVEDKSVREITLVGSEETQAANPTAGNVSIDSPIGKAVYNARIDEEVTVELPNRKVKYKITKIS